VWAKGLHQLVPSPPGARIRRIGRATRSRTPERTWAPKWNELCCPLARGSCRRRRARAGSCRRCCVLALRLALKPMLAPEIPIAPAIRSPRQDSRALDAAETSPSDSKSAVVGRTPGRMATSSARSDTWDDPLSPRRADIASARRRTHRAVAAHLAQRFRSPGLLHADYRLAPSDRIRPLSRMRMRRYRAHRRARTQSSSRWRLLGSLSLVD